MIHYTRKFYSVRNSSLSLVIISLSVMLHCSVVAAEELPIPAGFQIMPNGNVMVKDPIKAVAPAGYHISKWGELVKNRTSIVSTIVEAKNDRKKTIEKTKQNTVTADSELQAIPPGYHRMGNGQIMANNPAKAVVPPGYRLTEGGILKLLTDSTPDPEPVVAAETTMELLEIPAGFHRMPNGTLMANNPSKAVAPEGYHLMPDGTLMAAGSNTDHSKHSHKGGGMWMAEYKQESMYMDGLLDTTNEVTPAELVDQTSGAYPYSMSPTDMTMEMHMVMLMYHSRKYMVMGMLHFMSNNMGMLAFDNTESTMKSKGLGDSVITVTMPWRKKFDYTLGISLPTGSIDERGPMTHQQGVTQNDVKYPYGMQLGSGTYDFIAGLNYEDSISKMKWGVGYEYKLRTGSNSNNYTLGDKMNVDGWVRVDFSSTLNTEARLQYLEIGRISGADPELTLTPDMSPAIDAANYGGRRADLAVSLKYETAKMTSVATELSLPIYQNLFGPQMKTEWILGLKVGLMF